MHVKFASAMLWSFQKYNRFLENKYLRDIITETEMLTKIFDITSAEDDLKGLRGNLLPLKEMITSAWLKDLPGFSAGYSGYGQHPLHELLAMVRNLKGIVVTRVWRVRNSWANARQELFISEFELSRRMRRVYHGTTFESAEKIAKRHFDPWESKRFAWGAGIYTAITIDTASAYAKPQKQAEIHGTETDAENDWQTVVVCNLVEGNMQMGRPKQTEYGTNHLGQPVHTLTDDSGQYRCCLPDQLNPLFVVQFYVDTSLTNLLNSRLMHLHSPPWSLWEANKKMKEIDAAEKTLKAWKKDLVDSLQKQHDCVWPGWADVHTLEFAINDCFQGKNRWDDLAALINKTGADFQLHTAQEHLTKLRGIFPLAHIERYNASLDRVRKAEQALQQEEAAAAANPANSFDDLPYHNRLWVGDRVEVITSYADTMQLNGRQGTIVRIVRSNTRYYVLVNLDVNDALDEKNVNDLLCNSQANKAYFVWKEESEKIHNKPLLRAAVKDVALVKRPADDVQEGSAAGGKVAKR